MSLQIEFQGAWGGEAARQIEKALRICIGEPPAGETWKVSLSHDSTFTEVLVKTLRQTRRQMFFVDVSELAKAIPDWLNQYPLR
jgi:hypothetical protein